MKFTIVVLIACLFVACHDKPKTAPGIQYATSPEMFNHAASIRLSQPDSAFYYFASITENSNDSLYIGAAYWYMASIQSNAGDHLGCQESALKGLRYLTRNDEWSRSVISSLYDELAKANARLKNFAAALEHHDLSIQNQDSESGKAIMINNKAVTYKMMEDYETAINLYNESLHLLQKNISNSSDSTEYARTLSNLAYVQWLADKSHRPLPDLFRALDIRLLLNDTWGATTSYNHLAGYYVKTRPDSALYYSRKMYQLASQNNNSDEKLQALKYLTALVPRDSSSEYFSRYVALNDSINEASAAASNKFALVRFQLEKSKAENKLLQQDNEVKSLQINQQRLSMLGIVIITLLVIVFAIWWQRKEKQRLRLEKENAVRESQLKISQKVHDVVANGLYRVMTQIEHNPSYDKETALDQLEQLYEQSRDLSYEPVPITGDVENRFTRLLSSFDSPEVLISIVGNTDEVWENVSEEAQQQLEHILQELMVNMKKHSRAENVLVRFDSRDGQLQVQYSDDGVGFPPKFKIGNGLQNTENRILELGGEFIFTNHSPSGVMVKIVIPKTTA